MVTVRTKEFKKEINKVELTGFVQNLPDHVKYIQVREGIRPLISFDIHSYRPNAQDLETGRKDINTIVLFDNDKILNQLEDGARVRVTGELQSRNYNRISKEIDELLSVGVQNYKMITGEMPTEKQPNDTEKQVIVWKKLLDLGLILEIPNDSMFQEDMKINKTEESPYMYLVTIDGDVTKESQHVTYEVVTTDVEILSEELNLKDGDINKVKLCGIVGKMPNFNILGEKSTPFVSFAVTTESKMIPGKRFFNNTIAWGKMAQNIFEEVKINEIVMVKGRLQSRGYKKEVVYRWRTPSGNKKKRKVELDMITREVSVMYIEKQKEGLKKKNYGNKKKVSTPIDDVQRND